MTWLRNATTQDGRRVDVLIGDGSILDVRDPAETAVVAPDEDLTGCVLLPSFVEPYAHLDKALTVARTPELSVDLLGAITAMDRIALDFDEADIGARADAALAAYLANGTTAVRTHVTLGGSFGLRALRAMVEVRRRWAQLIDVQLVAMAGVPVREKDLREALDGGADVVGAYPHADTDPIAAVKLCFEVAEAAGAPVDLHTDETLDPSVLTLQTMAEHVVSSGFSHGVTASHCVSLGVQPADVQRRVSDQVASAGITVVTLPLTNLYLMGRDRHVAAPRALTALDALYSAGATVAAGGDNLRDVFHPLGRADALETAMLLVNAGHRSVTEALGAVTSGARTAMGLPPVAIEVGSPADLVAVSGRDAADALARSSQHRMVWKAGRLVSRTTVSTRSDGPGQNS